MSKEDLEKEIKEMLAMIFDSYGVLNHYQMELVEDTLVSDYDLEEEIIKKRTMGFDS